MREDDNAALIESLLTRIEKLEAEVFNKKKKGVKTDGALIFEAYREVFISTYGTEPLRNAQTNSQCKTIANRAGQLEGADVTRYYLAQRDKRFVEARHPLGLLLLNLDTLVTRMRTKVKITPKQAQQIEDLDANEDAIAQYRGKSGEAQ